MQRTKQYIGEMASNVRFLLKKWFKERRIIVVSESAIFTIYLRPWFQGSAAFVVVCLMGWLVYVSGQYLVFETILSSKEGEIVLANQTNQSLLTQMDALQKNLKTLNNYLQSSQSKDHAALDKGKHVSEKAELSIHMEREELEDKIEELSENTDKLMNDIYENVSLKIEKIEDAVSYTGLRLDKLKIGKKRLITDSGNAQGGPFIPFAGDWFADEITPSQLDKKVNYLLNLEKLTEKLPLAKPIPGANRTSSFGVRKDPITGRIAVHKGLDLVGPYRAKVYSSGSGRVVKAGRYGAYGRFVEIDHGNGVTSRYGHLSKVFVRSGQHIRRGQIVGLQGSTGRSTGSHLHYEVRVNGTPTDPQKFLKAGKYVL